MKVPATFAPNSRRLEQGQGLVEYALILVLVAVVVIVILSQLGSSISVIYARMECTLQYNDKYTWVTPEQATSVNANNYGCNIKWPTLNISVIDAVTNYPPHMEFGLVSNKVEN